MHGPTVTLELQQRQSYNLQGDMIKERKERYGGLSYILGRRSAHMDTDGLNFDGLIERWKPNMIVVRTQSGLL
jgi:hypothetical protein